MSYKNITLFFSHMIIYLLLRDNKAYNILKKVQKKLFVARKTIFCWKKKQFGVAQKVIFCDKTKLMLH